MTFGLRDIGDIVLGWTEHLSGLVGVIFLIAVQYLLGTEIALITIYDAFQSG
jgi:hypothetical protein